MTFYADRRHMNEWKDICRAFARREGAELLFVNEASMGLAYADGSLRHIYIDELANILNNN